MKSKAQRPEPRSSINKIAAYIPGKSVPTGRDPKTGMVYKLSSNESPLGPSPAAIEAISSIAHLEDYPDGNSTKLRQAIADIQGLNPERIVCGAGSDELLSLLASAFLGEGDEAIYSEHGFLMYKISILATGATPIVALEKNQTAQVDEILAKVTDKTRVVFLANPNNPTGTYLPFDEVKRLHAGLRDDILLILDAAYAEYVKKNDYESGVELVASSENVVMTRTFSKIYGLANLRIGWCFAPAHIADALNRIRGPFNTNGAAVAAGEAAIRDVEHINRSVAHNSKWLEIVTKACEALGLKVTPSVGNFILIHFPEDEKYNAMEADKYLQSQGCILRNVASYGFPSALRMTIGSEQANNAVLTALKDFLSD